MDKRISDEFKTRLATIVPWDMGVPKINGPCVFGARRGAPFHFLIPVIGERPLTFSIEGLPDTLSVNSETGIITGTVSMECETTTCVRVSNVHGSDEKELKLIIGDRICLTPPLGWNSWNVWGKTIDEAKVRDCADQMVSLGLAAYGFSYINIDDGWQGERGGELNALQPNEKFPDMRELCNYLHSMGLRMGIYSTPFVKSYSGYNGGSSGNCARFRRPPHRLNKDRGLYFGETSHHIEDAKQWAAWGIDYLKYDWNPWEVSDVELMHDALQESGRDIVYSLSSSALFDKVSDWARLANCWRTTGDIRDTWESVSSIGFSQDRWTPFAGPGHWNDPDMLVVGKLGWGEVRKNRLTEDEQITHITLWSILAAPLLLGCDLSQIDSFTLNLICNNEVLAVNQDPKGIQGHCVLDVRKTSDQGQTTVHHSIYKKGLIDGSLAVGLFNRADFPSVINVTWKDLGIQGINLVHDIWAQEDIGTFFDGFSIGVSSHGAQFLLIKSKA